MVVTQRARNSRSWETRTTPPRRPWTNASSLASPLRSRSLVGSSSRTTSKRLSSRAASATRAAWPPDSPVIRALRTHVQAQVGKDRRDPFVQVRRAGGHPAVKGQGVGVIGAGRRRSPGPRPLTSMSAVACAQPVRRAMYPATVSPAIAFVFLRQPAYEGIGRGQAHAIRPAAGPRRPAAGAGWICRHRWRRQRPRRRPGPR